MGLRVDVCVCLCARELIEANIILINEENICENNAKILKSKKTITQTTTTNAMSRRGGKAVAKNVKLVDDVQN